MSNNEFYEANLNRLTEYLSGAAHSYNAVGLEVEHFLVYGDTKEAIPYQGDFGVAYIMRELSAFYPDAKISNSGNFLGFSTDRFDITLEPAAQFEISIAPMEDISGIQKIYLNFRENLDEILEPFGYECVTTGYHPGSKAKDLHMIPKQRYDFMDRYFKTSGTMGINMMRATASTQVSIDYHSLEDFRDKLQAAYVISPYLKLVMDNSPTFEGEDNSSLLLRSKIWDNVDPKRTGIIPDVFKPDYSFRDYARYLLDTPPIFIPDTVTGNDNIYTGDKPAYECIGDAPITDAWISHLLSMVFPDIRVKSYIEIRVADSTPVDSIFAYLALIKGLFYSESFLNYTLKFIRDEKIDADAVRATQKSLSENGWGGMYYNVPVDVAHKSMLKTAAATLPNDEKVLLDILKR